MHRGHVFGPWAPASPGCAACRREPALDFYRWPAHGSGAGSIAEMHGFVNRACRCKIQTDRVRASAGRRLAAGGCCKSYAPSAGKFLPLHTPSGFFEQGAFDEDYGHGDDRACDATADRIAKCGDDVEAAAAGGAVEGRNQTLKVLPPSPPPTAPEIILARELRSI